MSEKVKIHEFDPVIYPFKLWVIISNNPDIIAENFNEYTGKHIHFAEGDVDRQEAFSMPVQSKKNPSYGVVIFYRSKKSMTYELVSHESSHAAKYLFEHIGADPSVHEPFEYLIGWIAGCCEKVKQNKF